jgi:hypothetical protein
VAKVVAVECDLKTCGNLAPAAEGAEIPTGWLMAEYYQEGDGNLEARVFCSWGCVSQWANNRIQTPPKRKRRTREQIEADEAAARATVSAPE